MGRKHAPLKKPVILSRSWTFYIELALSGRASYLQRTTGCS
jgi:hypothetical protein